MLREHLHYCPECIKSFQSYQLHWKLNNVDICTEHQVKLREKCGHCHNQIAYKDIRVINVCPVLPFQQVLRSDLNTE
jgi:uncharacterized CHY-type Zn-finger protein